MFFIASLFLFNIIKLSIIMITWRQFISDIQTNLKSITADGYTPPRFIYSETQKIIADFIRKDQDAKKKLAKVSEGWTDLDCIDLEEIDVIQCSDIDVTLCDKVMKSTKRLPNIHTYSYGNVIKHVSSINFSYFFEPITPRYWNNIQKRKYKDKNKYYYYIIDNYLYIPVPKTVQLPVEKVRMEAYFIDKYEVDVFKSIAECKSCKKPKEVCKSPLDYEVVIPNYLLSDVKKELLNQLAFVYLKTKQDNYANMNDIDITNQRDQRYLTD